MDIGATFVGGNTLTTTVTSQYDVAFKNGGGTQIGDTVTLSNGDFANPDNLKNINLGVAGTGLQVDLSFPS